MSQYNQYTWVEGVTQVGPTRMNALEAAVDDASKHHQSGTWAAIPAANATSRGWTYFATDRGVLYANFDGATWTRVAADAPIGQIDDFAGVTNVPAGFLVCRGQAVSRTTYSDLWAALRLTMTGNSTNGSATLAITGAPSWIVGYSIFGPGVQSGATVSSVTGTTVVMNLTANANNTGATYYIAPWGAGDGSTTFNVPEMRGLMALGADKMDFLDGSAARGVLSASIYDIKLGDRNQGETQHLLITGEIPSHNHTITMKASAGTDGGGPARGLLSAASNTVNTGSTGGGAAHENMPPFASVGKIIKAF